MRLRVISSSAVSGIAGAPARIRHFRPLRDKSSERRCSVIPGRRNPNACRPKQLESGSPLSRCDRFKPAGADFHHGGARRRSRRTVPGRRRSSTTCAPTSVSSSWSALRRAGSRWATTSSSSSTGATPVIARDQPRMREHKPDQQRLLFAGRSIARRQFPWRHRRPRVGQVRAVERAPGGGIARAVVAQHGAVALFDLDRRIGGRASPSSRRGRSRPGERPSRVAACEHAPRGGSPSRRATRRPPPQAPPSRARRRRAIAGRGAFFQQPVARAQRALERVDPAACSASTASASRSRKRRRSDGAPANSVSMAGEPDDAQMVGEGGRRTDRLSVDPAGARRRPHRPSGALDAGAERREPECAFDFGGNRPGAVAFAERHIIERGTAQAAAGREKRDRLDQIGLAGAVRPDQHDRPAPTARATPRGSCGNWSASGGGCGRRPCGVTSCRA